MAIDKGDNPCAASDPDLSESRAMGVVSTPIDKVDRRGLFKHTDKHSRFGFVDFVDFVDRLWEWICMWLNIKIKDI